MSTNKFLTFIGNAAQLVQAIATSAGAGDANKIIATNSQGKLDSTLLPTGVGEETVSIVASENLSAGDFVNIYDNGGTPNIRKADASNNRPAHGFVLASVAAAASGTVYRTGTNSGLTGLTIGATYFLSPTTAGSATATAPSADTQIIQPLGVAQTATELLFEYDQPILIDIA